MVRAPGEERGVTLSTPVRRRDILKPGYVFRSSVTGQFVSRFFALLHPKFTVKERIR